MAQGRAPPPVNLAIQFEQATDEAREATGLIAAEIEHKMAARAIVDLCERATTAEARTIAGIVIKAQAIDACSEIAGLSARHAETYAKSLLPFAICAVYDGVAL